MQFRDWKQDLLNFISKHEIPNLKGEAFQRRILRLQTWNLVLKATFREWKQEILTSTCTCRFEIKNMKFRYTNTKTST